MLGMQAWLGRTEWCGSGYRFHRAKGLRHALPEKKMIFSLEMVFSCLNCETWRNLGGQFVLASTQNSEGLVPRDLRPCISPQLKRVVPLPWEISAAFLNSGDQRLSFCSTLYFCTPMSKSSCCYTQLNFLSVLLAHDAYATICMAQYYGIARCLSAGFL